MFIGSSWGNGLALYSLGQAGNKKVGDGEVRPIAYENAGQAVNWAKWNMHVQSETDWDMHVKNKSV